jgi:hypothetical protein
MLQIFSFITTEFSSIADIVTTYAYTNYFWSKILITTDSFERVLLYILFYGSIVTYFIYTYIFYIIVITGISTIIVYSGPALSQKAGKILGATGTRVSIYTSVRTRSKDLRNNIGGDSKPSSSKPTDAQAVDYKCIDNKPPLVIPNSMMSL